ncbi:type I-F CRISPR-associated protein Csy2 [Enterovibrio coralii]|nr:type I-F CRISPR-associated protein Csy2 [Enterovibrio coralii]
MKTLRDVLEDEEPDIALRKAFAAYSELVDVTGEETQTLIVLLNLTLKRDEVESLTSRKSARAVLKDEAHIDSCLEEVRWLHSHNLKYPDTRVQAQRILCGDLPLIAGVLGSANCERRLGWSHNSSQVNKAKLFCSGFIWEGSSTCLAESVIKNSDAWRRAFREFGLTKTKFEEWRLQLKQVMNTDHFPSEVSDYSKQVRFPWLSDYFAITPVVSSAVLAKIQQLRTQRLGHFRQIDHCHPASVGDFAASRGGGVTVLNYPLNIVWRNHVSLNQSRIRRVESDKSAFNSWALLNERFIGVLNSLIHLDEEPVLRRRRRRRVSLVRQLRRGIAEWLLPIMEWRDSLRDGADTLAAIRETERALLTEPLSDNTKLLKLVNQRFHTTLQDAGYRNTEYAYHPKLLEPVRNQLRWILDTLGNDQFGQRNTQFEVIHLENLRVFDALSLANPYLVGIPSLTALWGFIHAFDRKLKTLLGCEFTFESVAWHVRESSSVSGLKLPSPALERKRSDHLKRPGMIESKHCDLVMDLAIRVHSTEQFLQTRDELVDLIKAALPSRFAGGVIHPPSLYESRDWCSLRTTQSLHEHVSRLPATGRWIVPATTTPKSFENLCELVELNSDLKPAMLGYQLLEEPIERPNSVASLHAYAEPLIGLCDCKSSIDIRLKGEKYFNANFFWKMDTATSSILMRRA